MNITTDKRMQEIARIAYHAQSFRPEDRGKRMLDSYQQELNEDLEEIEKFGADSQTVSRYAEKFKSFVYGYFSKESRCMSAMITGPARFPVRSNEKKQRSVENHIEVFNHWRTRAKRAIKRANAPEVTVSGELEKNIKKLESLKKFHEIMKTFNAMMRKKKSAEEIAQTTGLKIEQVQELLKPDFIGRVGFAQYQLSNNLATIKATEDRIKVLERKNENQQSGENQVFQLDGVKIEINHQADRIQIVHDSKPEASVIADLKRMAFKWSPTNKCWQRKITANALSDTRQYFKIF